MADEIKKIKEMNARIDKLPKLLKPYLMDRCKFEAVKTVKKFHDGIKKNSFHLEPLKNGTIVHKRNMDMRYPDVPLYGEGDDHKDNSYCNMMRLRKKKDGYSIIPSKKKHYSGAMKLKDMFDVHEHGATIAIPGSKSSIRIPPRPAMQLAYDMQLKEMRERKRQPDMNKKITDFIMKGKMPDLGKAERNFIDKNKVDEE